MEKLISMTERVLYEMKIFNNACYDDELSALMVLKQDLENHANFLSQKLELWMFVPCKLVEGVWVVLEFPILKGIPRNASFNAKYQNDRQEYQEAKDRVLFEGWVIMQRVGDSIVIFNDKSDIIEFINDKIWIFDEYQGNIINELCFCSEKENIPFLLTPNAQKQIS